MELATMIHNATIHPRRRAYLFTTGWPDGDRRLLRVECLTGPERAERNNALTAHGLNREYLWTMDLRYLVAGILASTRTERKQPNDSTL